ncbi:MAG: acetylornithine/acetyl-lysine aminotransferase [Actinomycetota bacterium]|jgi:acetylornithine/succinyldiaminopimelate/putrescine aminotransferase|nr:MAG: acetylornithine/acetyl-lysine aminotransferase [Actinomycetota bacterium]
MTEGGPLVMDAETLEAYRDDFLRHLAQTVPGRKELVIERARGSVLFAADGKRYLDMISGIGVSNVGHCHPDVVRAIKEQAERFAHVNVYGRFVLPPQVDLVRRLTSVTPRGLDVAFLTSTGTEAIEGALKLARKYTGRPKFVAFERAFHGRTLGSLSVSWKQAYRAPFEPLLPEVEFVPFDDVDRAAEAIDERTAAVIVEPIQGEGGVRIPSDGFLQALRRLCTERGALLICDEVQGGMGRSGRWFSFEHWGIVPDVVVAAKALGGGLPLGAFVSTQEIFQTFLDPPLSHLTTFGGNPISCAAAIAAFDVIRREGLVERAASLGARLEERLRNVQLEHAGTITEVRGRGLWYAVDVSPPELAMPLVAEMQRRGVIVGSMLHADGTIRIAPPLTVLEAELDVLIGVLRASLRELGRAR